MFKCMKRFMKRSKIAKIEKITKVDLIMFRNKAILLKAAEELGVKEKSGRRDNPRVVEYHKYANLDNDNVQKDSVPWCASFICWVLEMVGMISTNSMMARSYENWGIDVTSCALPGDLVVFWRDSIESGYGHIAVLLKETKNYLYCAGGNQNDEVNITRFSKSRLSSIRRSSKQISFSTREIAELKEIAENILNDEPVEKAGKVV